MHTKRQIWLLVGLPLMIALFLLAINLISALFIRAPLNAVGNQKFDVIIALGYPAREDGQPSPMMKQRVIKAVELFKNHHADHIIFTGGNAHNSHIEANIMAQLASSMGVADSAIVRETKASNTYQNALNSVEIMQARNWKSAIVVTSPNHIKRASYLFAHYPIHHAVASSAYPENMNLVEIFLFEQWEHYRLTQLTFSGYPK